MIMLKYRQVALKDNIALAKLIRRVFEEFDAEKQGTVYSDPTTDNLYALFAHPGAELWVAEEDEAILGCCGVYPTEGLPEGYAELVKYYISPQARGKGVGSALLNHSFESAKRLGYTHLYLESFPQFEKAVSIYKRLGFEKLDKPMGNSGHDACTIWMLKAIAE